MSVGVNKINDSKRHTLIVSGDKLVYFLDNYYHCNPKISHIKFAFHGFRLANISRMKSYVSSIYENIFPVSGLFISMTLVLQSSHRCLQDYDSLIRLIRKST